jgi:hypothetical protein
MLRCDLGRAEPDRLNRTVFQAWSSGFAAGLAQHEVTGQFASMGVMEEAIKDGVAIGRVADHFLPPRQLCPALTVH